MKQIPNFPNYFVDEKGNIWSTKRNFEPRKLSPGNNYNNGYLSVNLYREKKKHNTYIHRIVLETFVSPCPLGMESCHKDGNKHNNRLSNLRWGTRSSNQQDRKKHGTWHGGERNPIAKLNGPKVREIKKLLKEKQLKQYEIAEMFDVDRSTINSINIGRTWGHI